ncbi:MAG: hypothetical protein ABJA37_00125 [Ferruginibacter sp.]
MKIDKVYVICNREDFYLTKICIASIRYWNKDMAVCIIKDLSRNDFDSAELEKNLNVTAEITTIKNLTYYAKLYPLIEQEGGKRILLLDSDIVWMCDIIALLEPFDEDIIVAGYHPEDLRAEMSRWYFTQPAFAENFPGYKYPGFLFNVGHILCNTTIFKKDDFMQLLEWKEFPSPIKQNIFFYEQGMLNYLIAKKISEKEITYRLFDFQVWGWDNQVKAIKKNELKNKIPHPYLVHWYGKKNGLISFLPGGKMLSFYERFYYSSIKNGKYSLYLAKFKRSILHFRALLYEAGKCVYLFLKSPDK